VFTYKCMIKTDAKLTYPGASSSCSKVTLLPGLLTEPFTATDKFAACCATRPFLSTKANSYRIPAGKPARTVNVRVPAACLHTPPPSAQSGCQPSPQSVAVGYPIAASRMDGRRFSILGGSANGWQLPEPPSPCESSTSLR
jgi:hypothetical protein